MEKMTMENNENVSVCAKCNGRCCRGNACETHPADVFGENEPTIERLIEFLSSGNYQVDWWEGDVNRGDRYVSYFIRPAHTNSIGELFDPSWGGTCVFFEDGKGCKLSFDERPFGGKALIPSEDGRCRSSFSKCESATAWYDFNRMFDQIREDYEWSYTGTFTFTKRDQAS